MSKDKPVGQQRKSTDVRQREIVDAAMRTIAVDGARCFTAKNIAEEIGITSGAIFRHFTSMDAVLDAVIDRMEEILFDTFPPEDPDPLKRVEAFFKDRVRVILEHRHVARMLLSDHFQQAAGPEGERRIEEFKIRSRKFVNDCLTNAREKGLLKEAGPEECSILVMGSILALANASIRSGNEQQLKELSRKVWSTLDRMIRA